MILCTINLVKKKNPLPKDKERIDQEYVFILPIQNYTNVSTKKTNIKTQNYQKENFIMYLIFHS
jgi:hypothetical protein